MRVQINFEMKKILTVYNIAFLLLLIVELGLLYTYPKLELHLMLNSHHTAFQDTFFKYYTVLAEWPLYVLMLIPLLFKKYRITIFFAVSEVFAGVTLQILKNCFKMDRPVRVFEGCTDMVLPLVDGVDMHHSNSFPSGHSSTFMVFSTVWAIILAYRFINSDQKDFNKRIKTILIVLGLLILAVLGGYSRIYLSQHFLSDVCVGSLIGFVVPYIVYYFGRKKLFKSPITE